MYIYIYTYFPAYQTAQEADRRSGRNTSTHTHIPAYQTAQKADRRSGRKTSTHTLPCLPDRTKGRSPVREKHKYTHTSLPARPHKRQIAGQGETQVHTHTSLPTRPHKRQIAGQGDTQVHTHIPAYQTAQKADPWSGRNTSTHTLPCLPDRTKGRSPVREIHKYTHTSLPTRPHKRQIAGQGETQVHTLPCLPDRTKGRSPVREIHKYTHTSLPTRPHKRQIAGQE